MAITKTAKKAIKTASTKRIRRSTKTPVQKSASVSSDQVDTNNRPRRGRPVSVDVLKRKLLTLQTALHNEKQKRRERLQDAQLTIGTLLAEKRELRRELNQVKKQLQQIVSEQKRVKREEMQLCRIEEARNQAVARFLLKWDQQHQEGLGKQGSIKRKPGRPRKA